MARKCHWMGTKCHKMGVKHQKLGDKMGAKCCKMWGKLGMKLSYFVNFLYFDKLWNGMVSREHVELTCMEIEAIYLQFSLQVFVKDGMQLTYFLWWFGLKLFEQVPGAQLNYTVKVAFRWAVTKCLEWEIISLALLQMWELTLSEFWLYKLKCYIHSYVNSWPVTWILNRRI